MRLTVHDGRDQVPHRQSTLISYLVNDHIAIDAGALGIIQPLSIQQQVRHVFLSHSHADHTATLPLFVDNVFAPGPDCVKIYANQPTIDDMTAHIFNDRLWPDVARLAKAESPFLEFIPISADQTIEVEGVRVTPFDVDHVLPTLGFLLEDDRSAVAMVADTGATADC